MTWPDPDLVFEVDEHSGDLAITAWGSNLLEALAASTAGLMSQIVGKAAVEPRETHSFIIEDSDTDRQVVSYLNEIIYLASSRLWLTAGIRQIKFCESQGCSELQVILTGEAVDPARHKYKYDIKAVTFHEFKITQTQGRVTIHFVCDL